MKIPKRPLWTFLILWPLAAVAVSLYVSASFLESIFVFFLPPLVALGICVPRAIPRSAAFSVVIAFGVAFVIDTIAHASGAWFAVTAFRSRILGLAPWEDVILGIVFTTALLLFYEWSEDHHRRFPIHRNRWIRFVIFICVLIIATAVAWSVDPTLLETTSAYMKLGIIAVVIPITIELSRHASLRGKFIRTTLYWAYVLLIYELTAMELGWWAFPAPSYIGWFSVGSLRFPLEELVFFVVGVAAGALSYYESFVDDNR